MAATAGSYLALSGSSRFRAVPGAPTIRFAWRWSASTGGDAHVHDFHKIGAFPLVALCEPDQEILDKRVRGVQEKYEADARPSRDTEDIREVLDRKDVDARMIASPTTGIR
jgi:hypothetical protein